MTLKQVYEGLLVECDKKQSSSILLDDFNYLVNKSVIQWSNKQYNLFEVNQQITDNLRVLKSRAILTPTKAYGASYTDTPASSLYKNIYEVNLPSDYWHILNCMCTYKLLKSKGCNVSGSYIQKFAKKSTSDQMTQILDNYYYKPTPMRPYFIITNVNNSNSLPTNTNTDMVGVYSKTTSNLPRTIQIGGVSSSLVEKEIANRYGNSSPVRIEIWYGNDSSFYELSNVTIDYLKTPQNLKLTQTQFDLTEDESQIMEFPDYVCQEIINELVHIVLENSGNPRLNTHIPVNQSIAAQQQTQQTK